MENNKEIVANIEELKKQKNAVIIVHNYQPPEIQDIADIMGDSLELSRKAAETDAEVIVFCGVRFMAETASILSPEKTVLLPDTGAGCPMADMITAEQVQKMKAQHPGALAVTYVNSTAEVKAECDYCCTSGNALKVIDKLKQQGRDIIFVPDKNLGTYISHQTEKGMIFWEGYCPVHVKITADDIRRQRSLYPEAKVMVHPECTEDVTELSDVVVSTGGMVTYPGTVEAKEFIVGTEIGMLYRLNKIHPDKTFIPASDAAVCIDMKKITREKVLSALRNMSPEIRVSEEIRRKALIPLKRMLEIV